MSQYFNAQRWWLLVRRQWAENGRRYLLAAVAIAGLQLLLFSFIILTSDKNPLLPWLQSFVFMAGLFLAGPLFASQYFRELSSRPKAINYLLTPASHLEKFLCGLFYVLPLFLGLYIICFYAADGLAVLIANTVHEAGDNLGRTNSPYAQMINVFFINQTDNPERATAFVYNMFVVVQSLYFLGSVYFTRYSYVKTAVAGSVILFILLIIQSQFFVHLLPKGGFNEGLWQYRAIDGDTAKLIKLPAALAFTIEWLVRLGTPLVLWVATYLRLNEKEV